MPTSLTPAVRQRPRCELSTLAPGGTTTAGPMRPNAAAMIDADPSVRLGPRKRLLAVNSV
jgi:hypothetical protein